VTDKKSEPYGLHLAEVRIVGPECDGAVLDIDECALDGDSVASVVDLT